MQDFYKKIESEKSLLPEIESISLRYCEESQTFKVKNKWRPYESLQEVLDESVKAQLGKNIIPAVNIRTRAIMKGGKIKKIKILANTKNQEEEKTVDVILDRTMNPSYAKKVSHYLEGTLQLRNIDEEKFSYLSKQLKIAERKFAHVVDIHEKGKNIDIEMTSQHEIARIAREMQKQFGGELKLDYKLQTRDKNTQKDLYRINATVIFPKVSKGDVIEYEDEPHRVDALSKNMKVTNLRKGNSFTLSYDEDYKELPVYTTHITKVKPSLEVLHPTTYQSEPIQNPKKKAYKDNQKIKVTMHEKGLFFLQ